MQVIQTINDTIRILFSPIDEDFKLLDFLLVQEADNKYLAQIIEIYDDKYDASQNVARVKLFFKVNDKGEVFGYDHFTPSKECEIKKIKRDEILTFINEGKEALSIGLDYQSGETFDINLDFIKNHPVIFADKLENSNNINLQLASVLSRYNKHSVIFDFSGTLEIQNAKRLILTKDVMLPLDFNTINYIWGKGLSTASLETQAICREIFNEIQTFAKNIPEGFIPFNKFLEVIEIQYKATPIIELTVLLNKLNAYQKKNIFANRKKDFEGIKKSVEKNEITIIDFSELKTSWHKEFCEFAIRNIKNAFVFIRLNETNSDTDLINFIYDKNPDIFFVPSISYTYPKMPHIIERANNYILLPTLNPKRDFGAANFELASIAQDECILFGQNTENFIFTIKNNKFVNIQDSNSKTQKIINLNLNENQSKEINLKEKFKNRNFNENDYEISAQDQIPTEEELDFFEQVTPEEKTEEEKTLIKKSDECNVEQHYTDNKTDENEHLIQNDTSEDLIEENEIHQDEIAQELPQQSSGEEQVEEVDDSTEIVEQTENIENNTNDEFEHILEGQVIHQEEEIETIKQTLQIEPESVIIDEIAQELPQQSSGEEQVEEVDDSTEIVEQTGEIAQELPQQSSGEEQVEEVKTISSETEEAQEKFQNILEESEESMQENTDDSFSLEALATQSIENTFNEVIGKQEGNLKLKRPENTKGKLIIDENVVIDLEKIKDSMDNKNENELPIFKNKIENKDKAEFKAGDKIEHDKYGVGEVVKVINYANRSLLQINFEQVGKRLLDPDIASIREIKSE